MKILNISAQKPNSTGSGVYLTELVNNLELLGHKQAVVAGVYEDDIVEFEGDIEFFPVYFGKERIGFDMLGMSDEMPYKTILYKNMTEQMCETFKNGFLKKIKEAVDYLKPDVIICHHLYLLTAIVREAFPDEKVVGISHGTGIRQLSKHNLKKDYITKNIKKLDMVFALQEVQKQRIKEMFSLKEDEIKLLGVGFKNEIFNIKKNKKYKVMFAGKISCKKGVKSLIKAMDSKVLESIVHNTELNLAGGAGNEEEFMEIKELANNAKANINFIGKLDQKELAKNFNENDVFVLPSFYEGLPLVLIEALACGLKVVSSDLPGVKEWINENIKDNNIKFVQLPAIVNCDEPVEEQLPIFEENLAKSILKSIEEIEYEKNRGIRNLEKLSWMGIAQKMEKYLNF